MAALDRSVATYHTALTRNDQPEKAAAAASTPPGGGVIAKNRLRCALADPQFSQIGVARAGQPEKLGVGLDAEPYTLLGHQPGGCVCQPP